jgi:uncharacterized C2H2 Zn-finger protein
MKKNIHCPNCDTLSTLQSDLVKIVYKGHEYSVTSHFYKCPKCNEEFTTTESDTPMMKELFRAAKKRNK